MYSFENLPKQSGKGQWLKKSPPARGFCLPLLLLALAIFMPQLSTAKEVGDLKVLIKSSPPATAQEADGLGEIVRRGLLTNPQVNASWEALQSTANEQDAARGGYFPRLDFSLRTGYEEYRTSHTDRDFDPAEGSLTLTQMLYDGFATSNEVKRLGHEKLARLFDFFDSAEATALEIVTAYIDLLRYRELLGFAEENLQQHQQLFNQVEERVNGGKDRGVDLDQARGRLALAQSNVTTERNNLHDVNARYLRLVGELPQTEMPMPSYFPAGMIPPDIETALRQAFKDSPAINAAVERMLAAENAIDVRKASYQPRVELRAHHKTGSDRAQIDGHSNESLVELALDFNLFRGGADKASVNQFKRNRNQAKELRAKACRDVRQTETIAYNDIYQLESQLRFLEKHRSSTAKARKAYREQFNIGRRSLLDLLDTQNEYFQSQRAYTKASYDYILAYARTLEGMGQLLTALDVRSNNVPSLEALLAQREDYDAEAFCPVQAIPPSLYSQGSTTAQSIVATTFAPERDNDSDGVPFSKDLCPDTPAGTSVGLDGCAESDKIAAEVAPTQQLTEPVDQVIDFVNIRFDSGSSSIPKDALLKIARLADGLKNQPNTRILLDGHTDSKGSRKLNEKLSHDRVAAIREHLIFNHQIPPQRIYVTWLNADHPVADNDTAAGRSENRRVGVRVKLIKQQNPAASAP